MAVSVVDRSAWGAKEARSRYLMPTPAPYLFLHHAGVEGTQDAAEVRAHQRYHMVTKGWLDIAYSFLIANDGTIYEGRGWGVAGGHTENYNSKSHAFCLLGNFQKRAPTPAQENSFVALAQEGIRRGMIAKPLRLLGHRDVATTGTVCPGIHAYGRIPNLAHRILHDSAAPAPAPKPTPSGVCEVKLRVLRRGSRGGDVKSLQALLNAKAGQRLAVDGDFGPATEGSVKKVQKYLGLAVDGIVGTHTWTVLFL